MIFYKRLAIIVWFPFFLIGVLFSMILWPLFWIITGVDALGWWIEGPLEPFGMAQRWGVMK